MKKSHKAPPKSARQPQPMPPNKAMLASKSANRTTQAPMPPSQRAQPPMGAAAIPAMPLAPTAKLGGGVSAPMPAPSKAPPRRIPPNNAAAQALSSLPKKR